jgi:hypothetical protein
VKEVDEGEDEGADEVEDGTVAADAEAPAEPSPADAGGCGCNSTPLSGTHAERYQVMIHVDAETLAANEPGRSHLDDGTPRSSSYARRTRGPWSRALLAMRCRPLGAAEAVRGSAATPPSSPRSTARTGRS